jgi:hypothetical protein
MLTIIGSYSYMKTCINSLRRFIGLTRAATVLICMCERCGYGRSDHPETARKPWVVTARPQRCKGCGSPEWDHPKRKARRPLNQASVVSAKSAFVGALEFLSQIRWVRKKRSGGPSTTAQ